MSIHSLANGAIAKSILGLPYANAVAVAANGMVYVTNGNGQSVSVIDDASKTVVATIAVGALPSSVAVSADCATLSRGPVAPV